MPTGTKPHENGSYAHPSNIMHESMMGLQWYIAHVGSASQADSIDAALNVEVDDSANAIIWSESLTGQTGRASSYAGALPGVHVKSLA